MSTHTVALQIESTIKSIMELLTVPWRPGQLLLDLEKLHLQFNDTSRPTVLILAARISIQVNKSYSAL